MKVENKSLKIISLSLGTLILAGFAYAWTEPGGKPPINNTPAPVTIMGGQIVEGGLLLGNNPAIINGLIIRNGRFGIGTVAPGEKVDIKLNSNAEKVAISLGNMKTYFGVMDYNLGEDTYTAWNMYRWHDPSGCHGDCSKFYTDTCNGDQTNEYTCNVSENKTCTDHSQGRSDPTDWFRIRTVTCLRAGKIELQTTGGTY